MDFQGFIGPSYTLSSVKAGSQRLVNMYLEVNEAEGRKALVYTPGLRKVSTAGTGPNRGNYTASNERAFCASGSKLYEITDPENPVDLGNFVTSSGTVSMADNGVHLICVDGVRGYTFKFSDNTFAQIADPDFPLATYVAFQDQYLIVNDSLSGNFFLSALSDATDWDGLDFAAAESYPDKLVRLIEHNEQLILLGSKSTEGWFNSGELAFPFARIQGSVSGWGTKSPDSFRLLDNNVFGLMGDDNGDGMVMKVDNFSPSRISTFAIEHLLSKGNLQLATSWSYQIKGHTFYVLNAPGMPSTPCYDVATSSWHERSSAGSRHRAEGHCVVDGLHIVGDYQNGNLYELDSATYTDNGTAITRTRRAPHINKETNNIFVSNFGVDVETGMITDSSDPICTIRISRDGGHVFGSETQHSMGKVGTYKKRVQRQRCGTARDFVFEWSTSAALPVTITGAYIDVTMGRY